MAFGVEFQTSSELYKNLKKYVRKNARINYQACHSIVADPSCNHGKRAQLVARDIRKLSHVSFKYVLCQASLLVINVRSLATSLPLSLLCILECSTRYVFVAPARLVRAKARGPS